MRPLYRHPVERVGLLWTAVACALGAGLGVALWSPGSGLDKTALLLAAGVTAVATGYQALFPYCFVRDGRVGVRTVRGLRTVAVAEVTGVQRRDARAPLGRAVYRYPALTVGGRTIPLDRAHYRPGTRREQRIEQFLRAIEPVALAAGEATGSITGATAGMITD
ncbi:hypothetical protein V5P93_001556 [Actinokineospora auranticolor]|uniref:Uncharacterized protein n=1 Tax=Actinokineospora auranticolor TaxID=155976 RepID=A0A2S6GVD2_9PSEU|nr:hypothetical protein [Actinokineospora auranticolor]PPK69178.1 hypothetical protein CLV40_104431 [Actinokineospora auranticolor]